MDMLEPDIEKFRSRLVVQKTELEALEASTSADSRPVELDQASVGRLSRMDAMQGQAMAQETARRRRQRILAIEGALRRIESGDYGYCFKCGEEIDPRRLEIDAASTRCMRCLEQK